MATLAPAATRAGDQSRQLGFDMLSPAQVHKEKPPVKLSENSMRVLKARYLRRDGNGNVVETPRQMFERVALAVAQAELAYGPASQSHVWEERFFELMSTLDFLPNSPTLMNAGTSLGQLSACFVLPIEDTLESIFQTLSNMAMIQRSGGGTGFAFSRLRAAGERLSSSGGISSGPISFMRIFDSATENIKLGGRRRGANMAVLRVDHADIEEFIECKRDGRSLRNFNLSAAVTDEFMSAIHTGRDWPLRAGDGRVVKNASARALFDRICSAAWETGDPGLLFIDTINRASPTPADGIIESTNPCGEVPLLQYECCNLGSINLTHFVSTDGHEPALDWERLRETVHTAVRFLDDVVTINRYPLREIEEATLARRKIGLGIMGFAEACILLSISYASEEALAFGEQVMKFIAGQARQASALLAEDRGAFPAWSHSIFASRGPRLRNATQASIAPTGTVSLMAGTSSGIEPLFALAYRRVAVLERETLFELNPLLARYLEHYVDDAAGITESVIHTGQLSNEAGVPLALRRLFVTALEVSPEQHVRVQAAFQRHVDNAVSKTVNLPADSSVEEIAKVFLLAHELNCKGVTVFRYGSKSEQVLQLGAGEEPHEREYFTHCDPAACKL
ncbi:MAG: adenosylcobalamin-dependent ribonucleoside-diphosphate reductase [Candidatus Angelobacter sp.]